MDKPLLYCGIIPLMAYLTSVKDECACMIDTVGEVEVRNCRSPVTVRDDRLKEYLINVAVAGVVMCLLDLGIRQTLF